jgi:hypothetical protein
VIAVVVFAGNCTIAWSLDRFKVLDQYDILFDADLLPRLRAITEGNGDPFDTSIHPAFAVYFSHPLRWTANGARALHLIPAVRSSERVFRRKLGILVMPALSGLTMAATFLLFLGNGLRRPRALLMTSLCALSFSQVIFGSVPDHFAMSGLLLAVLALLASDHVRRNGKVRWVAWSLTGGLIAGVTITNIVEFAITFAMTRAVAGCSVRKWFRDVPLMTLSALAVMGVITLATPKAPRNGPLSVKNMSQHAAGFLRRDLGLIPRAILDTFAPCGLRTVEEDDAWIRQANMEHAGRCSRKFLTERDAYPGLVALALALTACGAWGCLRRASAFRAVGAAALGVLAFDLTFHAFWGDSFFLYTQHWLIPLGVLLSGNLTWPGRIGRAFTCAYGLLAVVLVINDYLLLNQIFGTLGGASV